MLQISFRKSLSFAFSLSLVASLLIASQQISRADDVVSQCDGGFNPVFSGRVVDASGNAIPEASVQATYEIDYGWGKQHQSTNGYTAADGSYEMCPILDTNNQTILAPIPAVGSDVIFTVSTWNDPSITIKNTELTNDDVQCIEAGGPCIFDIVLKQGEKASFRSVSASNLNSGVLFDVQFYGTATVIDEGEGNWLDVFYLGSFPTSETGNFDVYGMSQGEFRMALRPNQADNLMSTAWQILINESGSQTVTKLTGWGDGEAVRSDSTSGNSIDPISGVVTLPNPVAKTKFMLTDGISPLSTEHLAFPDDRSRVVASGSGEDIRFISDPYCQSDVLSEEQKQLCWGLIDINYKGEFLLPWENGFYQFGAHFGYNPQGVETYFVFEIANSEIVNLWRHSGYAMNEANEQVIKWQKIDLINNSSGVINGLTLHQQDLGVKLANYEPGDFWIGGYLCRFDGECNADEMPSGQFSLYGGNVSEIGQIAFPDATMLGVSCDDSTSGSDPELQLLVDAGGWTPANSTSSRYAIDCSGSFGNRSFSAYELHGLGDSKTIGEGVNLQSLSLDSAQIIGVVRDPNGNPVNANSVDFYPIDIDGTRDTSAMNYWQNLRIQNYWGTNSNHFGKFNLSALVTGSYAVTFSVEDGNGELAGAIGKVRLDVVVSGDGTITSAHYGNSLSVVPSNDALNTPIEVVLKPANFIGSILSQNGKPRSYQYFQVQRFNSEGNINWNDGYEYFNEVRNTQSYGAGSVAVYLPQGQYRISLPAAAGNPKTDFDIWVDSAENTCPLEAQTGNDLCGVRAVSNWTLRYAQPNLAGTVTANDVNAPAQVNVYTRNSSGWWQSIDWINASDGEFAARLAASGYYRLELQPQSWSNQGEQPLEGFVRTIAYVKVDSNKKLCIVPATTDFDAQLTNCPSDASRELSANFALEMANLTIGVSAPTSTGGELHPAQWSSLDLRETTSNQFMGENFWSQTNVNGKAFLKLPQTQGLTRFFDVTIRPNGSQNGFILASKVRKFCTTGNGNVYPVVAEACVTTQAIAGVVEVVLAEGNVSGRIKTSGNQNLPQNSNAYAEVRIWDNTCPNCAGNSNTWGWKWTNNSLNNSGNGTFGGDLDPGTYLVKASTWRSNFAPGSAIIRVGTNDDEHPWCLVAADAEVLDIPEYNNSESKLQDQITSAVDNGVSGVFDCDPISDTATSLNVLLKSPNISGTITDPSGANIKNAWGNIYKVTGNNDWNREYVSNFSVQSGKFVGRVKLPTTGSLTYGIQFEQPQGQVGSRFVVTLNCTSSGCVNSVGGQSSESLTVSYPAPNFVGRICSPDSVAAAPASGENPATSYVCDPVKNTNLNLQTWNVAGSYWQWGNLWANTNSRGEFSLNIPNGRYRATAYPSWNNPKGVQTNVEFSIVSGTATFDSIDDKDAESPSTLDLQLLGPNVIGTLKYQQGTETKTMQYGGISASLRCTNSCPSSSEDRWAWTSADRTGSYRLRLPTDGTWDLWVYANSSQNPKPPMQMIAVVQNGEVISWSYAATVTSQFNPEIGEVNFDALPANLSITVSSTSEIRIVKFKDSGGNYVNELTTYTSGGSQNTVDTRVPQGQYTIEILKSSRESTSGTISSVTVGANRTSVSVSVS